MARGLSDADRRVWRRVTRTVAPKSGTARDIPKTASREAFAAMMRVRPAAPAAPRAPGPLEETRAKAVRRGRVRVDARIDLHDLTLASALPALERGLIRSWNRGHACVLVITGKGVRREGRLTGVLRAALPGWLAGPTLRPVVATYSPAHPKHGGEGAWYVFLKRAAPQGK